MRLPKFIRPLFFILLALIMVLPVTPAGAANSTTNAANTAVVATGALNVRSGPGIGYNVVAVVYQGTSVTLIGRNAASTWVQIRLNTNVEGWVNASLLSASVTISSLPLVGAPTLTATGVVATGALNVRSGPSVAYPATAVVNQGAVVTLLGRNANSSWVRVRLANSQEGWVNASLLQTNVAVSSLPLIGDTPPPTAFGLVNTGALNVRTGPDVAYDVVTVIGQGTEVLLIGRNATGSWVKIRLANNQEGWVNASLLRTNVAVSSLPVADAPAAPVVPTGAVTASYLNVRSGPDVSFGVVTTLRFGENVGLVGRNNVSTWINIRLATGHEGWVNARYLNTNVTVSSLPVVGADQPAVIPTAVVATGALNVRSGPGVGFGVVTVLSSGQSAGLTGRTADNSWVKLLLPSGVEGWVNASYINANVALSSLPVLVGAAPQANAVVATGALNIRYGPDVSYGAFAIAYQGTALTLIGRNGAGTWVKVQLPDGNQGWVNVNYLTTSVNIGSLPQAW